MDTITEVMDTMTEIFVIFSCSMLHLYGTHRHLLETKLSKEHSDMQPLLAVPSTFSYPGLGPAKAVLTAKKSGKENKIAIPTILPLLLSEIRE
jgi:hypothetical protein